MKKIIVLVLALMLLSVSTVAEEDSTPAMFLGSRGLMVLDENTMKSMGAYNEEDNTMPKGVDVCIYSPKTETSSEAIMFTDNDMMYVALSMASMFVGQDNGSVMGQTFYDFCKAYDFEYYAFGDSSEHMTVYVDYDAIRNAAIENSLTEDELSAFVQSSTGLLSSKDDFLEALVQFIQ